MIKKFIKVLGILTITTTVHASPASLGKCPGVGAIAAAGLSTTAIERDANGLWAVAMMKHNYDTDVFWTFVVGNIMAADAFDAYKKATASLSTLNYVSGPYPVPQINRWACSYSTGAGYPARTVTPVL